MGIKNLPTPLWIPEEKVENVENKEILSYNRIRNKREVRAKGGLSLLVKRG